MALTCAGAGSKTPLREFLRTNSMSSLPRLLSQDLQSACPGLSGSRQLQPAQPNKLLAVASSPNWSLQLPSFVLNSATVLLM